jgi:hypothetical protein
MTLDTNRCEKAIQLLIKARGSSWGNTGSTPHFESGESPVSHESSKMPILSLYSMNFEGYRYWISLSQRAQIYRMGYSFLNYELFSFMNYELFHVNYRVTDSAHQKKTAAAGPFS